MIKGKYEIILGGLVLLVAVAGGVLSSSVHADDVVDEINITVPVSCSFAETVSGNNTYAVSVMNNEYEDDIGHTTFKVFCNDKDGYSIYAVGYSEDTFGNTEMVYQGSANPTPSNIVTGTATSGSTSNWAMKMNAVAGTYAPTLVNGFGSYRTVPSTYTKVATFPSQTDNNTGSSVQSSYAVFVSATQPAGTYEGKVRYTLVHPNDEIPTQPQPSTAGYINYYANASTAEGTMGRQSARDGDTVKLYASNFSRTGYGFAGWSDAFDYATNSNAHFYGPNEDIVVPTGTTANGLALYAVWIKSAGTMQENTASVCNSLTAATYNDEGDSDESTWSITANLNSISALTDTRDGQTYAIAKLTDGNCWMIENLRLADKDSNNNDVILSSTNTNNPSLPLTNIYDTSSTSNHLSPTSSIAYAADTAPEGWCDTNLAACYDQSRLRTNNTANRATYTTTTKMTSHSANLYSYGNYYNWYSATAGNGTYSKSSGNTAGDICPAGWHLPTGDGSGEFGILSNSLGGRNGSGMAMQMSSSTTPTVTIMLQRLRHFPNNLLYSGNVNGASLSNRGSYGYYWSSTAASNFTAFRLNFYSSYVDPGTNFDYKYRGWTVRCIAPSS